MVISQPLPFWFLLISSQPDANTHAVDGRHRSSGLALLSSYAALDINWEVPTCPDNMSLIKSFIVFLPLGERILKKHVHLSNRRLRRTVDRCLVTVDRPEHRTPGTATKNSEDRAAADGVGHRGIPERVALQRRRVRCVFCFRGFWLVCSLFHVTSQSYDVICKNQFKYH